MSNLRRRLHVVGGWILGLMTGLSVAWLYEGKPEGLTVIGFGVLSVILLVFTALDLILYAIDGVDR